MIKGIKNKKKVIVAMSGGVDSSVAAALLKKEGYEVAGVFMHFWAETRTNADGDADKCGRENACCGAEAEAAARAVAAKLKIPFYTFHFEKEFKKQVVDYFLAEEALGRTPNPCVVCNKKIKFGLMFERAMSLGTDFVATGHYARVVRKFKVQSSKFKSLIQNSKLFKAKDANKDQSYFLYNLGQEKLARILFPLGDLLKSEVYALAKKWRLPYRKDESFDICFAGRDLDSFIRRYLKLKTGDVVDIASGKIIGRHDGLALYTISQRKRLMLAQGPWFVAAKDEKKNILFVTKNEQDLYSDELSVSQINWLSGAQPELPMKAFVKIRYKSELAEATVFNSPLLSLRTHQSPKTQPFLKIREGVPPLDSRGGEGEFSLRVVFKNPQRAITAGQSAVFYSKKGELLGGGVID